MEPYPPSDNPPLGTNIIIEINELPTRTVLCSNTILNNAVQHSRGGVGDNYSDVV